MDGSFQGFWAVGWRVVLSNVLAFFFMVLSPATFCASWGQAFLQLHVGLKYFPKLLPAELPMRILL